jgi:hypothetical protein
MLHLNRLIEVEVASGLFPEFTACFPALYRALHQINEEELL